jgi:hypothetical protein
MRRIGGRFKHSECCKTHRGGALLFYFYQLDVMDSGSAGKCLVRGPACLVTWSPEFLGGGRLESGLLMSVFIYDGVGIEDSRENLG